MEGNDQAARAEDAKHRTGYYPPIRGMIMENPYNGQMQLIGYETVRDMQLRVYANAVWDEGHTAGKAEQAEIVTELAEAARTSLTLAGKGEQFDGEAALHTSYVYNLIAKATQ